MRNDRWKLPVNLLHFYLHFFVSALKSVERVKGIEPSFTSPETRGSICYRWRGDGRRSRVQPSVSAGHVTGPRGRVANSREMDRGSRGRALNSADTSLVR